jgi:hypothetical protein
MQRKLIGLVFHRPRLRSGAALCVLSAMLCAGGVCAEKPVRLIAHRGGVVDAERPENSAGALQDEIRRLRAQEDNSRPLEFLEYAPLCRNRIELMIDTKEPSHPPRFYAEMEQALRANGLLAGAYFIGTAEARAHFKGKARISADRGELERALRAGEDTARLYFLFEHGRTLEEGGLQLARRAGVPAVASINDFHYAGMDHLKAAHADILRLRALGLAEFQIDSIYDGWLRRTGSRRVP